MADRRHKMAEEYPERPQWMEKALCAGQDPKMWFSLDPDDIATAKQTCTACPVRLDCQLYGGTDPGIWGGLDQDERRRAKRAATRAAYSHRVRRS